MARRVSPSAADERPRDLRAVIVRTGGGFPVRLERGLGDPRWGAHQAAGGTLQAQPQPGLHRAGLSSSNPCDAVRRSEEHTSELQSLMRLSYAVFCLKKNTNRT